MRIWFGFLTLIMLSACVSTAMGQYRKELREMRATAEKLCEERGGLKLMKPIPEMMHILSVFDDAGEYSFVKGAGDPNLGGTTNYMLIEGVPKERMAKYTRPIAVNAYAKAAHYLSTGKVQAVDFLIEGFQRRALFLRPGLLHDGRLLPDKDQPNGMYRYALIDAGSDACEKFDQLAEAIAKQGDQLTDYLPRRAFNRAVISNGKCISISYLGPKESYRPPGYVYHGYRNDLPELRVRQEVDELFAPNGELIARLLNFSAGTRMGRCSGGSPDILKHEVYR